MQVLSEKKAVAACRVVNRVALKRRIFEPTPSLVLNVECAVTLFVRDDVTCAYRALPLLCYSDRNRVVRPMNQVPGTRMRELVRTHTPF